MSLGEGLGQEHTLPRPVPAREPRDLMLAEEIIRFASITDRPSTSGSLHKIEIVPNLTNILSQRAKEPHSLTSDADGNQPVNEPTYKQSLSSVAPVAEAGRWESVTSPSNNFQEPRFQIEGDGDMIDQRINSVPIRSREFRPNLIPVTNSILAAMARCEKAENTSGGPMILELIPEDKDKYWPTTHKDLLDICTEEYKRLMGSDYYSSSSSDSLISSRSNRAAAPSFDDKETSKHHCEETGCKKKQKKRDKVDDIQSDFQDDSDRGDENQGQALLDQERQNNQIDEDDFEGSTDSSTTVDPLENESSNDTYNTDSVESSNSKISSELKDADNKTFEADWSENEKERLSIILRNMSRDMKAQELQSKRLRLKRNGRTITQAIAEKICAITTEIQAVHKKQLSQVALPLDEIQNYNWTQVAAMANRSPEECRRAWELFLHPSKNNQ